MRIIVVYLSMRFVLQIIVLIFSIAVYCLTDQMDNYNVMDVITGATIGVMLEGQFIQMKENNILKL
ncbi:hypothetical protein [Bacillus cereus]|uniref:hypothetical protein n=1 Tax=Bacillus cereus TaxID=1396 RepID=UPI00397F4CFE